MGFTTAIVTSLIGLVIGVIILTSLGTTVADQTYTGACGSLRANDTGCGLENATATSKTMYGLIELLYPIIGVLFVIIAGFGISKKMGY